MIKNIRVLVQAILLSMAINFPAVSQDEVVEKVVTEGIGSSVDRAIQNGAERALMQVVGVYVDTETMISKRKEIRDGIKTEAKSVSKELLQVSNGSIKDVEVLEVLQDGDIFRVEVLVEVRIDNVKILIEPFIAAKKEVSKGLFASINKNKQQAGDKVSLINKRIIRPILSGEHVEVKITGVQALGEEALLLPDWLEDPSDGRQIPNFLPRSFQYFENSGQDGKRYFDDLSNYLKKSLKADESVVVLGVETRLSDEMQSQINDILEQVSKKKHTYNWTTRAGGRDFLKERRSQADRLICTFLPMTLTCYVIDVGSPISSKKMDVNGYLNDRWDENMDRALTYRTSISLIGEDNEVILDDMLAYINESDAPDRKLRNHFNSSSRYKQNRHLNKLRAFSYMVEGRTVPDNGALFIPFVSGDLIYIRLEDEQLAKVQSVEVSIEKSEEFIKQTGGK
jgi:hypothetical protein